VGDWTVFPPLQDLPFLAFAEGYNLVHTWNSPPAVDPKSQRIEVIMPKEEKDLEDCCVV
jgi:hypothetical protein